MASYAPDFLGARITPRPHHVTPLYLVDDIASARRRYGALGFKPGDIAVPGCLHMRAGDSGIMLVTTAHAISSMPHRAVSSLRKGPALFVSVDSVDVVRNHMVDPVIGERVTPYGTWELFVESRVGLVIFAERTGAGDEPVRYAA